MKKYLMKIKVNMLIVLIISLLGGMAGSYFFNNRWLGMLSLFPCALCISIRYIRCRPITANSTPKRNTLISTDKLRLETQNCPEAASIFIVAASGQLLILLPFFRHFLQFILTNII